MTQERPRVLCVDDEPSVLDGLKLHLHRLYEVQTATSGAQGLHLIQSAGQQPFTVVLSDMRMAGMDGATFLGQVRRQSPDTVRMLLTGQANLDAAVAAVNEGQIFRFLTKPCPPPILLAAFAAAIDQHRLLTAERVLLEQTLRGTVKTLIDILALTNPAAFGRANRIRRHAMDLARELGITQDWWQLDVAAMLSQLSCIILPADLLEKLYQGKALDEKEQGIVERLPAVTEQLLSGIPRLEEVLILLKNQDQPYQLDLQTEDRSGLGSHILRLASDFDTQINHGRSAAAALETLNSRPGLYDGKMLDALAAIRGAGAVRRNEIKEIPVPSLEPGMVLAEDICTRSGMLLSARGHEVTGSFLARLGNFQNNLRKPTVKVVVPVT